MSVLERQQDAASIATTTLEIEKAKLALEQEKLEVERYKARLERSKTLWTAMSVVASILVAAGTIVYGAWSLRKTAEANFVTKAAEIALQGPSPWEARNRARTIAALFGDMLPPRFVERFEKTDPSRFGSEGDETIPSKKELIKLLAERPSQRAQILRDWRSVFPGDDWTAKIELKH